MTSVAAQRIQNFRALFDKAMRFPVGPLTDMRLYELSQKLRTEAHYYITSSTLDIDFLAWMARERAAGRTYSSEQEARLVFSQAGVVAPPESLKTETLHVLEQGH